VNEFTNSLHRRRQMRLRTQFHVDLKISPTNIIYKHIKNFTVFFSFIGRQTGEDNWVVPASHGSLAAPPADWRRQLGRPRITWLIGLPSGRLEKTTGSSPHHMAQHHPTGSETSPSYAPRSSRFGSEPPSVEDDVDVWRYAIVSCMPETTTIGLLYNIFQNLKQTFHWSIRPLHHFACYRNAGMENICNECRTNAAAAASYDRMQFLAL